MILVPLDFSLGVTGGFFTALSLTMAAKPRGASVIIEGTGVHTAEATSRLRKPAGATMDGAKTESTAAFADFIKDHPMVKAMATEFTFVYLKGLPGR